MAAGDHDSVRALEKGEADLAGIDPSSRCPIAAEESDLVTDRHRIGHDPVIPTPSLTARTSLGARLVADPREAFDDALRSLDTAAARSALRFDGFARLGPDDCLETLRFGSMT